MINIDPTILIIMGEVILALLVAMVAAVVVMAKGRKRDRQAVAELQARLKSNAPKRQQWYENVLAESIEDGDSEANRELASSWVEKENHFYSQLVNMYMKRNSSALRGLDKMLHEYTSSYLELVSVMRTRIDEEQSAVPEDARERLEQLVLEGVRLTGIIGTLEQENARLSTELADANREIDQAMHEYSLAFRPGSGTAGAKAAPAKRAAISAAGAAVAAAVPAAVVAQLAPEGELAGIGAVDGVDRAVPGDMGSDNDLEALTAELLAGDDAVTASESSAGAVEEMDLSGDELAGDELAGDELAGDELAGDELAGDELAGDELAGEALSGAAAAVSRGPVIDLADEGDLVLPELNQLLSEKAGDMGDPLPDDDLPLLEEGPHGMAESPLDEARLLAQLEGEDEIELPQLNDMAADGMDDLNELLAATEKGEGRD